MPVFHLVMTFLPFNCSALAYIVPSSKETPLLSVRASRVLVPVSRILAAEMFVELNNKKMFF